LESRWIHIESVDTSSRYSRSLSGDSCWLEVEGREYQRDIVIEGGRGAETTFSSLRFGYDIREVDAFRSAVRDTFLGGAVGDQAPGYRQ
jgi:hypothetical protein